MSSKAAQSIAAIVAGIWCGYLIVGPRVLNPLDLTWLSGDPAMNQVGWEFYRRSRGSFTHIPEIGYPFGASVAVFDLVPPVAMFLKLIGNWLPENFQYLGLLFVVNMALLGYFAVRLFRQFFRDDWPPVMIGSAFVLLMPALTVKGGGHFALTAHWLLVAAISYYMENPRQSRSVRYLFPFVVLSAVAASINPYLTVMVFAVVCAAVLRLILLRLLGWLQALGAIFAIAAAPPSHSRCLASSV